MLEVPGGNVVFDYTGYGHQEQAPPGHLSLSHMSPVCLTEDLLSK